MSRDGMSRGLCAFPVTPADRHGQVDPDGLGRLLGQLARSGANSAGLLGSTGTYAYLGRGERRRAVEIAAGALWERLPLIVGVGALRTEEAQGLARCGGGGGRRVAASAGELHAIVR